MMSENDQNIPAPLSVQQVHSLPERHLRTPPIDIYDSEAGLVLVADLPGVVSESLELNVQQHQLSLFGKVSNFIPNDAKVLHREYLEGDFLRSFILSDDVDHDRISAKLNNGVLEIVLPSAAKPPPRKIPVNTET